jgi:hypothetical protein
LEVNREILDDADLVMATRRNLLEPEQRRERRIQRAAATLAAVRAIVVREQVCVTAEGAELEARCSVAGGRGA